ncbi:uncharacterized protein N7511_001655 [Penicillium nucicola]|uniref:uncharacterized protein n=1 Tax=Penicillium nucicola TaxID=1850975 RepID=UPI002545A41C|nr:uncharacterized protein N7511_001655 [Penicillium nucicola]KAJ5776644.1 hypothetical protein N7511_001655 [Penicillium nucicola]
MASRLTPDPPRLEALVWGSSQPPTTFDEWQAAIKQVKSLNMSQQYKQCVLRCKTLLGTATVRIDRIHETALHYYSAISYVSLAQAAHIYSASKIPFLKCAVEKFIAASNVLPDNLSLPVLNPGQTYSLVDWAESPSSRTTSGSPLVFDNSPGPESPLGSSPRDVSPVLVTKTQLAEQGVMTPPPAYPLTPPSSGDSLTTAFIVTPRSAPAVSPPQQLSPFENLSPVEDTNGQSSPDSIPAVSSPRHLSPIEDFPLKDGINGGISPISISAVSPSPYRHSSPSRNFSYPNGSIAQRRGTPSPVFSDQESVSFNNSRNNTPIGESLIDNITLMLHGPIMNESEDASFISKKDLSPKIRSPVQLSPVSYPADIADPRTQIELIPSPLSVRKISGEVIRCNRSMILCGFSKRETIANPKDTCNNLNWPLPNADARSNSTLSNYDTDKNPKRPVRPRPPRLPLKIIPRLQINVNESQSSPTCRTRASTPRSQLEAILESTQETPPENNTGLDFNKSTTLPVTPEQSQASSSYTTPSPTDSAVTAFHEARVRRFNSNNSFLREVIPKEITRLYQQIEHVENLQHCHCRRDAVSPDSVHARSQSFWTFSPLRKKVSSVFRRNSGPDSSPDQGPNIDKFGNVLRIETKLQRISRLRKEGWKTGIRAPHSVWKGSDYYEKFCDEVLADIANDEGFY